MTLPTSTRVTDPYETDGVQRDFEFDFPAFYNPDTGHYGIEVRRLTALDYEVIDKSLYDIFLTDENKSGFVRFHAAPMAGDDIYIAGDTTRSQQLNLINYGRYHAESVEKGFDLVVALIQEFVSKVDEETRQRILADQALRDFLLIKFNQFTAEVTTKIDKHIGDINGFMSSLIPMFVCIMRKEIANYAETGMMQVINDFMDNEIEPLIAEKVNSYLEQTDFAGAVNQVIAPIAEYVPLPFESQKAYKVNQRVTLSNGDIVKSTVDGNTVDPNVDMTGWSNPGKRVLNLDDFKTGANTDADAFYAMLTYAKSKGIKSLNITRDITLNRKITMTQDATLWLNSINIDFHGHKVNWTGVGADSLSVGIIEVKGVPTGTTTTVTTDYAEYTSELTVANTAGFAVGDWILIDSASVALPDIYLNILVKIEAISGNVIQTDTVRRLAVRPSVAAVNITKMNVVDGFKIVGNPLATATNQTSRANGIGFVQYQYAVNSHAYVRSEKLWFKTFRSSQCSRLTVIAHGEKPAATGGGEGYVIQLEYTTHSVVKATGDNMRHAVDLSCSWHNNIIDSYDFESKSASFGCHAAYEYNNNFWRCVSVRSAQYGFQFASVTGTFGDTVDEHYLHDCQVLESSSICVNFANKGKGLYINGGRYDGKSYSLLVSNNDTIVTNAKLFGGVQVTSSADMYTGGVCELRNCETVIKSGTRSINLVAERKIKLVGGSVSGAIVAGLNTSIETVNTDVICPSNASLIGNFNTVSLKMTGGKFIIPDGATADQTNILKSVYFDGVEFVQTDGVRGNSLLGIKTVLKNCSGSSRLSFNGTAVTDLEISNSNISAVTTSPLLTLLNMTGKVKLDNNTLSSSGNTIVVGATNTISKLQMIGNDVTGVTSIQDAQVTSGIVQGNMFAGSTTLPTNNGTTKFVDSNIITA